LTLAQNLLVFLFPAFVSLGILVYKVLHGRHKAWLCISISLWKVRWTSYSLRNLLDEE
jgi:hypothetical protein